MPVPIHMDWRHVLFDNWPVDPATVAPHLPAGLAVDTFGGDAWLSVVPFTNVDVRPTWVPAGWGVALPELNLRTYVRHDGGAPGVYFLSLDAQGVLAVLGARVFHHLPYHYARIDIDPGESTVAFESRRRHPGARPAHYRATYAPSGERFHAEDGTLAAFLTDRDRYYTVDQRGRLRFARVDHGPWPLFEATVETARNTLFAANGFDQPDGEPVRLYSPGVDTRASASRRV